MALPEGFEGFEPFCITPRRSAFLAERAALAQGDDGGADCHRWRRLGYLGTNLPAWMPGRAALVDAGVLAVEEVYGAGVAELCRLGLSKTEAEALINAFDQGKIAMTTFQIGPRAGERYEQDAVALVPSTTKTASHTSDTYELGDKGTLALDLAVTAISGSGAFLHVQIETRRDSDDSWRCVDAFSKRASTGTSRRSFSGCDRYVRAVCTFSGTSTTFSLTGVAY